VQRDLDLEPTLVAKYVVMGPLLNERTRAVVGHCRTDGAGEGTYDEVRKSSIRARPFNPLSS
jgi:hypothetical protein